jgi:hypothetical protein
VLQSLLSPSLVTLQRCSISFLTVTEGRPGGLQRVRRWMSIEEFESVHDFSILRRHLAGMGRGVTAATGWTPIVLGERTA